MFGWVLELRVEEQGTRGSSPRSLEIGEEVRLVAGLCFDAGAALVEPRLQPLGCLRGADDSQLDLLRGERAVEVEGAVIHQAEADVHVPAGAESSRVPGDGGCS